MAKPGSERIKIKKPQKRLSLLTMSPRPPIKTVPPEKKKNQPVLV